MPNSTVRDAAPLTLLHLLPALAMAATPVAAATPDIAEVLAFADSFDRAQLAKDGAALEAMVADDLVFIDSSGKRQDKRAFIAGWTDPGDSFDPVRLVDRRVVLLGRDAAVVSAETTLAGTSGGKRFASRIRFSDTFVRMQGKWRAVHIQVTLLR